MPTGTVYQRRSDGRWCAAVRLPNGQRVVRYARTEREAARLLAQLQAQATQHQLAPPTKLTVGQWWAEWLARQPLRPSTMRTYQFCAARLLRQLGACRLDRVTPLAVQRALDRYERPPTARVARVALHHCLRDAVRLGILAVNPVERTQPPAHQPRRRHSLTADEARALVAACRRERSPVAAAVVVLLATGLRVGELLALRGADVDLPRGELHVTATRGRFGRQPPKTASAIRTVPLPPLAREALGWLPRPLAGEVWVRMSDRTVARGLARLCRLADIPPVVPHALRHTYASLALAHGAPLAEVSRALGHSSVAITASTYAHALGQPDRVARALEQALGAAPNT